jgi:hypothetical protein
MRSILPSGLRHLAQQSGAVLAYREEAADHLPFRSAG